MNTSPIPGNISVLNSTPYAYSNNKSVLSKNEIIGIIVASSFIFLALVVLTCLIIYQKVKSKIQRKQSHTLTSNNPCYISEPNNGFDSNVNHAHCNASVLTDFYDMDDLNSLDNDNFLNSLEHAIFVGYLNRNRPTYSVDHSLSQITTGSTTSSTQPIFQRSKQQAPRNSRNNIEHSFSTQSSGRHSVQLRGKKSKRITSGIESNIDHSKMHTNSETGCEITRSTSNLISNSKKCLTTSTDSVCDSSRGSKQIAENDHHYKFEDETSRDRIVDNKTESSNDSRTSVNSSSAMMSSYLAENNTPIQKLPDLVNSSLPKSAKRHKKMSASSQVSKNDYGAPTASRSGQILDPLRAGQSFHFSNENLNLSMHSRHEHHLSHSFGISNVCVFDYNVST